MTTRIWIAVGLAAAFAAGAGDEVADAARLERWWRSVATPHLRFGTRDFYAFALEAVAAGVPAERIDTALRHGAAKQDRDPASKTFGNFAGYWEDARPDDRNCVEFSMQRASLIALLFRDRLSPAAHHLPDETFPETMDKALGVLFSGTNRPSFLIDARADPYGQMRHPTGGGHLKAHHVYPFLASLQNGPDALRAAAAQAGGEAFRDEPVFLRDGEAAAAVRFLLGTTAPGEPPTVEIVDDGRKWMADLRALATSAGRADWDRPSCPRGRGHGRGRFRGVSRGVLHRGGGRAA